MFVVVEQPLRKRQGDKHQLVVIIDLVHGKRTGDEGVLMAQRQVGTQHVDSSRALRRIQM